MTARWLYGTPGPSADSTVGAPPLFSRDACVPVTSQSNNAAEIASVTSPRAPTQSVANSRGAVPAKVTSVASAVLLSQGTISTKGTRPSCAVPGSEFAKRTCAHSVVPLSRGINSATGGRVSNAAPLNHGRGACASGAAPPSHASRSNEDAATARRPPSRTCSPSPRSDQVVAVGLRCGRPTLTLRAGHKVVVGLRCGKANTKTPTSLVRLDPVFTRDSSGRSILFPIKGESSRLATSFPFSKRANGKEPPRVRPMLPPTRAPLNKTPTGSASPALSSRTLTHVHQATAIPRWSSRRTDTARRASGDATASSLISWTLFP